MADIELLRCVIPATDGWYCTLGLLDDKPPIQKFHKTLEEVEVEADRLVGLGRNAYFGCGKFKTNSNRDATNCDMLQSFLLDK
jgi:hypothetical protein